MATKQKQTAEATEGVTDLVPVEALPEVLFADYDPAEREELLSSNADRESVEDNYKKFTHEEKQRFKDRLSDVSIELNDKEEELKAITKVHKEGMKPLVEEKKELLANLKTGAVWVKGEKLYWFVDYKTNMIGIYDRFGIRQRYEKLQRGRGLQTTIKQLIPKAIDEDEE